MELLDPASLSVWTADRSLHAAIAQAIGPNESEVRLVTEDAPPAETIIAFDLPSGERLEQLRSAGDVVMLVPPEAEAYVARIAKGRRSLTLPGLTDSVLAAVSTQRAAIIKAMDQGNHQRAILTLAPLFERFDPAAVAAALFDLWTSTAPPAPPLLPNIPATSKIYAGVGKKDGVTANDLVAVLTKELKVQREKIGRIELRETYSLIEIPTQEAERVANELNGVTVRRKRVTARVDRGPTRTGRRVDERTGRR
jgi:ATP-dependent RNA helicase DeaD